MLHLDNVPLSPHSDLGSFSYLYWTGLVVCHWKNNFRVKKKKNPVLFLSCDDFVNYEHVYIIELLLNWLIASCAGLML